MTGTEVRRNARAGGVCRGCAIGGRANPMSAAKPVTVPMASGAEDGGRQISLDEAGQSRASTNCAPAPSTQPSALVKSPSHKKRRV